MRHHGSTIATYYEVLSSFRSHRGVSLKFTMGSRKVGVYTNHTVRGAPACKNVGAH